MSLHGFRLTLLAILTCVNDPATFVKQSAPCLNASKPPRNAQMPQPPVRSCLDQQGTHEGHKVTSHSRHSNADRDDKSFLPLQGCQLSTMPRPDNVASVAPTRGVLCSCLCLLARPPTGSLLLRPPDHPWLL